MQPPVQLSSNPPQTIRWFHVFLSAAYRQHTLRSAGGTDVLEAILISPYRFVPLDLHDLHFHSVVADLGGKAENLLTDESFRSCDCPQVLLSRDQHILLFVTFSKF